MYAKASTVELAEFHRRSARRLVGSNPQAIAAEGKCSIVAKNGKLRKQEYSKVFKRRCKKETYSAFLSFTVYDTFDYLVLLFTITFAL
ncbi:hypothetical protein [Paenibacillus polymyxa]|uniref:hypothetical protein n=1 Tax=Paenibacillus polymyxa TaxID=1406 RepID=UPI001865D8EB|nr:hypothetical protein [Paenibacillus polymyxa]MBE3649142.1 hypothetical protein [Paenibacillus polymyxa]